MDYLLEISGMEMLSDPNRTWKRINGFIQYWGQFPAARVIEKLPWNVDAKIYQVVFDSSTWTGRK